MWKGACERKRNSRKPLISAACILTHESRVKSPPDIRALTVAQLDTWESGEICSLMSAVELEAKEGFGRHPTAMHDEEMMEWATIPQGT